MNPEDDPLEQLMALKAASQEQDPLDELMKLKTPTPKRTKLGQAGVPISDESPEDATYAQQALGGIAAFGSHIPGVEAAQAGIRSLLRGEAVGEPNRFGFVSTKRQPYSEALSDIRSAKAAAPKWVRRGNSLAGGAIAAAAAPTKILGHGGSIAMQGARYGAAEGLLSADPQSAQSRVLHAGKSAALTAAAGKVLGEFAPNAVRALRAKPLGSTALKRTAQMETADAAAYGKAASEGVGASHPAVTIALDHPTVQPFANEIRKSPVFANADDATVLREAYKLMTEKQQTLAQRVINSSDYKAGSQLEKTELGLGKRQLLTAADKLMPSFRPAVYGHATAKGELDAFRAGADATGRIVRGASVAGKKLGQNSPEAFKESIHLMSEQEAKAALEGVLGRLHERTGSALVTSANPFKVFGIPRSLVGVNRMSPYIGALDGQAGNAGRAALIRALALSMGASAP